MKSSYQHPRLAENSLPVEIAALSDGQEFCYQILDRKGTLLRKGSFRSALVYISTCMLPKGEEFLLRIHSHGELLHEGAFQTL